MARYEVVVMMKSRGPVGSMLLAAVMVWACSGPKPVTPDPSSSSNSILSFEILHLGAPVSGEIDEEAGTITVTVPFGTDFRNLAPRILHDGRAVAPRSDVFNDFALPTRYEVTAEDGTSRRYEVRVIVAEPAEPAFTYPPFFAPHPTRLARFAGGFVVTQSTVGELWVYDDQGRFTRKFRVGGAPVAVAVRDENELLVGNRREQRVDLFSIQGRYLGLFADGIAIPSDVVVSNPSGQVYVSDSQANVIRVFDADGAPLREIGSVGSGPGQLRFPTGLAIHQSELAVADFLNSRVQVFELGGEYLYALEELGEPPLRRPTGLDFDFLGNLYVVDSLWAGVYVYDSQGRRQRVLGEHGRGPEQLRTPLDVVVLRGFQPPPWFGPAAADGWTTLLVADMANQRLTPMYDRQGRQ